MAETTRNDTTYSEALLRLHAMEESLLDLWSRYRELKAIVEDLEPGGGGGSGDQDRIYNLTVKGAQVGGIDDVPQGPSLYDDVSMHQFIWGVNSELRQALENTDWSGSGEQVYPIAEKIASPWHGPGGLALKFWKSHRSLLSLLVGRFYDADDMYEAFINGTSFGHLAFGHGTSAAELAADGKNLYGMIKALEFRVTMLESLP